MTDLCQKHLTFSMYPYTPYPLTPIGSFIGIILSLVPLLSFQSWNTGTCMHAIWIALMNIVNLVNTIVWHNNANIIAPAWCDIGAGVGVPACTLVICLHLFKITRMRATLLIDEKSQKRRALLFDLAITVGIPVFVIVLWIVVQPYRFDIIEEIGCQPVAHNYVAYIILYVPQFVLVLIAAVLSPFTLQKFILHRRETNALRATTYAYCASDSGTASCKHLRIMTIASLTLLLDLPLLAASLATSLAASASQSHSSHPYPYAIHTSTSSSRGTITQTPASKWGGNGGALGVFTVKWLEWIYVLHALIFFAIFGTTPEATRRHRSAFRWVVGWVICKKRNKLQSRTVSSEIVFNSNPRCPLRSFVL
ncbi:fungal pheromone STE3G-protein-coupled receptor [Schizopora paradoxa]|uniref:Fungal pheromone STE3G-protein-coupled receptor n=1 Tax=Schizopora paradoxa TaxID=27342 RepID=A0A0H2S9S3_9AGAM|nr:fungal pheromone STE3G-protein-coupled receptor [Schizopora paradoxa]